MRLSITHTTRYEFSEPVNRGLQRLRLYPKSTHGQSVVQWDMVLDGAQKQAQYEDQHNNTTTLVSVDPGVTELMVTCTGIVETADHSGVIGRHSGHMPLWVFLEQTPLTKPGPRMRAIASNVEPEEEGALGLLHALSRDVLEAVTYEIGRTQVDTPAEKSVEEGHGVCQDHAHAFIGMARHLGIPARYVSGYLMMNDRIDQEAGHAWAEGFVEGLGWVGFDVSNGISPDVRYVRVATGLDYSEAAPITGISYGSGEAKLAVDLAVEQHMAEQ